MGNKMITCFQCGKCCEDGVYVEKEEGKKLERSLDIKLFKRKDHYPFAKQFPYDTSDGIKKCMFLGENGKCKAYNNRPRLCREFPLENGKLVYFSKYCEGMKLWELSTQPRRR